MKYDDRDIEGSIGTLRVDPRPDVEAARRSGRTRANIEAVALEAHPGDLVAAKDMFDELCDALGVTWTDTPTVERAPGICGGCGSKLLAARTNSHTVVTNGLCRVCNRKARRHG